MHYGKWTFRSDSKSRDLGKLGATVLSPFECAHPCLGLCPDSDILGQVGLPLHVRWMLTAMLLTIYRLIGPGHKCLTFKLKFSSSR